MGVNNLPKTVTRQRHGCDLNLGPTALESSTLITRLPGHPLTVTERKCADKISTVLVWAGHFQCYNINAFSNKMYGSNSIKQHSENVMV